MTPSRLYSWLFSGGLLGLLAFTVATIAPIAPQQATAAPPAPLPDELQYIPHDAAFFIHADAAAVWASNVLKTFREADKATIEKVENLVALTFGAKLDSLKNITLFFPQIKNGQEGNKIGVVLRFNKAFDQKKLEAGLKTLLDKNAKLKIFVPSDTLAVVLLNGLDEKYSKPQPADADGHLTPAIKAASKHTVTFGYTLANLPDELQMDDLPGQVQAMKPLFQSHAVYATVDLDKSLTLDVHVKAKRAAQAREAEKALSVLVEMIATEVDEELADIKGAAEKDAGLKDLLKVSKAAVDATKAAKFSVDGNEARMTATLKLDGLPLASAYTAMARNLEQNAAVARSANNLKQIGLAMHNYASANKDDFPPAAVCDKKGKPQLSWRVLILPYIEQNELYKQFKLDEPWDSEHNKKLIEKMPAVYKLPGAKEGTTDTHYRVFVGNGAAFDWVLGRKITTLTDGTSNTIMLATAADAVPWTKPDELEYDAEKDPTKLIGFLLNEKTHFVMCDGSVRTYSKTKFPSKKTLHAAITHSGGEILGEDF